jgi:hypothetical protein
MGTPINKFQSFEPTQDKQQCSTATPKTLLRTMLGICIGDLLLSMFLFLGTLMQPAEDDNPLVIMNVGNFATCTLQGMALVWGVTASATMHLLYITYSLLMVGYHWKASDLTRIEPYAAVPAVLAPTLLAIIPIPFQVYNPQYANCLIAPYTINCMREDPSGSRCTRGESAGIVGKALYAPLLCITLAIIVLMFIIEGSNRLVQRQQVVLTF